MISFQFETYIADGAEHYSYGADYGKGMVQTSKTVSFPESLLSLVDMNIDEIEPAIRQLNEVLWQLTTTREKQYVEEVNALLDELELRHIYFQQLALDWRYRLSRAVIFEQYTEDMLPRKYLYALPDTLRRMQGQIVELFENVLDADNSDEPTSKRMVDYYQRSGETAFRFYPQPIGFELIGEVFTEVLTPNNIYDILDFQLRACVKQEIKMRRCKNCGRYFAVMRHGATEYCGRVADERGRTCREPSIHGRAASGTMRYSRSTAESTKSALRGSRPDGSRTRRSTHGVRKPEKRKRNATGILSHWRNSSSG